MYDAPKRITGMNAEEIRQTFFAIADASQSPEMQDLIHQLGELMYARLQNTSNVNVEIQAAITALRGEFVDLSLLLISRLKNNERDQADKIRNITDRVHNLGNRFMSVENKVDETVELIDLKLQEILQAVQNNDNRSTDTTTTD